MITNNLRCKLVKADDVITLVSGHLDIYSFVVSVPFTRNNWLDKLLETLFLLPYSRMENTQEVKENQR